MQSLNGKTALVTGGASGIGAAISRELVEAGAKVIIHYFSSETQAKQLAAEIQARGGKAELLGGNLASDEGLEGFGRQLEDLCSVLDVLVNNAGDLVARRYLADMDSEFYRHLSDLNVNSMIQVTKLCLPMLKRAPEGSSIVNVSSLAGRKGGHAGSLAYATVKGAVLTFTRALAGELAPDRVRVNAVAPGLILGTRFHAVHTTKESAQKTISTIPLGRAGTPEDVARAVTFLASEYSGFITGATLDINGGVYSA